MCGPRLCEHSTIYSSIFLLMDICFQLLPFIENTLLYIFVNMLSLLLLLSFKKVFEKHRREMWLRQEVKLTLDVTFLRVPKFKPWLTPFLYRTALTYRVPLLDLLLEYFQGGSSVWVYPLPSRHVLHTDPEVWTMPLALKINLKELPENNYTIFVGSDIFGLK